MSEHNVICTNKCFKPAYTKEEVDSKIKEYTNNYVLNSDVEEVGISVESYNFDSSAIRISDVFVSNSGVLQFRVSMEGTLINDLTIGWQRGYSIQIRISDYGNKLKFNGNGVGNVVLERPTYFSSSGWKTGLFLKTQEFNCIKKTAESDGAYYELVISPTVYLSSATTETYAKGKDFTAPSMFITYRWEPDV